MDGGSLDAKTFLTIAIGDTITCTFSADQRPTNPARAYREVVTRIDHRESRVVTLLDEGYEALCEPVGMSQIQGVVKP
jgi:hypothetical protein